MTSSFVGAAAEAPLRVVDNAPQAAAKRFCLVAAELRDRHALSEVPVGFLTHCEEVSEGAEEDDAS